MSWKSRINTYPLFVSLIFALRFEKDYSILVSVRFNLYSMWGFLGMSGRVNDGAKIWPASSNLVSCTRNTEPASPLARANSIHVSPGPRRGSSKLQPTSVKKSKSSGDVFKLFGDLKRSASNKSLSGGVNKQKKSNSEAKKSSFGASRPHSRNGSKTPTGSRERQLSGGRPTSKTPTKDMDKLIPRNKKPCEWVCRRTALWCVKMCEF